MVVFSNGNTVTDNSRLFLVYCDASMDCFGADIELKKAHFVDQPGYDRV